MHLLLTTKRNEYYADISELQFEDILELVIQIFKITLKYAL